MTRKGRYINFVEGGPEDFCGVMKHFRHISMDHKIFFKIFDGLHNIFLCSIFVILFLKLRGLEYKVSKLAVNVTNFLQ